MRKASLPFCFLAKKETTECAHPIDGKEGEISIELWFLIAPGATGVSSEPRAMRVGLLQVEMGNLALYHIP